MDSQTQLRNGGFAGSIVAIESHYLGDCQTDYSVYAWNAATLAVEYVGGFQDYAPGHIKVDGPQWVVVFYAIAKDITRREHEIKRAAQKAADDAERESRIVRRGKLVEVVRGRKIPKGTVGTCFWVGECKFGWRVGIELANGERAFTASSNVEVCEGPTLPLAGSQQKAA